MGLFKSLKKITKKVTGIDKVEKEGKKLMGAAMGAPKTKPKSSFVPTVANGGIKDNSELQGGGYANGGRISKHYGK